MFIAALAFAVATGLEEHLWLVIAAIALLSTAYTLLGGLKGVVWTDVAQGSMFFVGASIALAVGLAALPFDPWSALREAWSAGKLQVLTFADPQGTPWYASKAVLPSAVIGGFFLSLATYGTDQENVQHLLNTRSERGSVRALVASGLFTFPVAGLFLAVGTMLWLYHRHVPVSAYSAAEARTIFPNFIVHAIPIGLRGLVFAGLFAAAMANLGAMLNAAAATWTTDIRPRALEPRAALRRVRALVVAFGAVLALLALGFTALPKDASLIHTALSAMTILYGGILGVFLAALLFEGRGSDASVVAGLAVGVAIGALLFFWRPIFGVPAPVSWPLYIPISASATLCVAALGRRAAAPALGAAHG
jgi:Na+/proline symporter